MVGGGEPERKGEKSYGRWEMKVQSMQAGSLRMQEAKESGNFFTN